MFLTDRIEHRFYLNSLTRKRTLLRRLRFIQLRAGVNVNGASIPIVALVNIDIDAGTAMVFVNDHGTTVFHYDGGCRGGYRRLCVSGSSGHGRGCLRTGGDSQGEAGERQSCNEC